MKKVILYSLLAAALVFTACRERGVKGNGEVVTENRSIEDFSEIEVSGAYNINITVGSSNTTLSLSAEENLQKFIITEVSNNRLIIDNSRNILPKRKIRIDISIPELEYISSSGISNIYADGIDEQTFTIDLSGAGVIELFGKVENFEAELSGAALLEARELFARFVDIDLSGASNAQVYVSEKLNVDLSGTGNLEYFGDPLDVVSDVSGVGSITRSEW